MEGDEDSAHIVPGRAEIENDGSDIPPFVDLTKAKTVVPPPAPVTPL